MRLRARDCRFLKKAPQKLFSRAAVRTHLQTIIYLPPKANDSVFSRGVGCVALCLYKPGCADLLPARAHAQTIIYRSPKANEVVFSDRVGCDGYVRTNHRYGRAMPARAHAPNNNLSTYLTKATANYLSVKSSRFFMKVSLSSFFPMCQIA